MKHALLVVALLAVAVPAAADVPPTPAAERSTAFEAVEGASGEEVSGFGLMVTSYALVWAFTMVFVARMARLEGRLAADVERLEKAIPADEG